jgi:hypothetical protein
MKRGYLIVITMQATKNAQAQSIEEVIRLMDGIIHDSIINSSRLGFFASLYRTVTIIVKERCDEGFFEDNDRMRKLDVIFANRYFEAYYAHKRKEKASESWQASFEAATLREMVILQHLLLGMNAHISLDLGVATADVANGELNESLRRDFYRLNNLLAGLIDTVQHEVGRVSPLLIHLDKVGMRLDESFVSFGINIARDKALDFAELLVATPRDQWNDVIIERDKKVAGFSRRVLGNTRYPFRLGLWFVNLREIKDARKITETMSNETWFNAVKTRLNRVINEVESQGLDLSKRDTQLIKVLPTMPGFTE